MAKKMRRFAEGGDASMDEEGKPIGPNENAVKEYFSPTRGTMEDGKYTPPSTYERVKNVGKAAASMIPRGVARVADKVSGPNSEEPTKKSRPDPNPRVSDSESAAGEEVGRRLRGGDYYIEPGSYEKRSVESDRMEKMRRSVASNPEQEKKSLAFLKNAQRSKDEDGVISVSPGKQYVRGDTPNERRRVADDAASSALRKQRELAAEPYSPENSEEFSKADKKTKMLTDAYAEEVDKGGYKEGGMVKMKSGGAVKMKSGGAVKMKSGGSVRGAGIAQRGQGKMRMC